jgi:nucleotide-binding universal stress UspA family protein
MPARLTKQEKLERLVEKTRKRVDDSPDSVRSLRHCPDSALGTLVREAGNDRVSDKLLEDLDEHLERAGIGTHPKLTDPSNTARTRIHFFDLSRPVPGFQQPRQLFAEEKELSRFLQMNWERLAYVKKHRLRLRGREVRIAENAIIDLLAVNKNTDELVGFELKVSEGDDRLVGQATKYISALKKQADKEGRAAARLVIVTGQPDEELDARIQDFAEKYEVKAEWLLYNVSIDLSESR